MRRVLFVILALAIGLGAVSCNKEQEAPIAPAGHGEIGGPQVIMPQGEPQVVVPETTKGKWTSVVITVQDKAAGSSNDVTIKLGGEYKIPNSTMVVKAGEFLPDFKMQGAEITSMSNELNNPAVRVTVMDADKEIFKGWLYSKFPAIHPFQHDKYGLTLKEAVAAK